jgi:hypothetical protein
MSIADDMKHPLYRINLLMPGRDRIDRSRRYVFLKTFNETKVGEGEIMEEYIAPQGQRRTTLNADVRGWLRSIQRDDISILAGYGLTWITIWSKEDAVLFKMFYLT